MTDYISREAANEACREAVRRYPNSFYNGIEAARDAIRKLPAADVRPVARGKWIERHTNTESPNVCYFSSCCGFPSWYGKWNFCPNCGADMREES